MDKKAAQQSSPTEAPFESIPKHQHNTAPQHLRLVQYGLKIPNSQHQHLLNNLHQHAHQSPYQTAPHRYIQASTPQYIAPNIQTNPMHHQYTNESYTWKVKQQPNSNLHVHNAINHQGTQIWVPHQLPPTHQVKSDIQPTPKQTKLPKEPVDRKKSNTSQQLRSPSAKRPPDAPVTLQGWLYKQGSEGFMLWKKRWFVLSEYCLFYYKSSEEEKLLGSILLPSYKVSICGPDEKVNKKFAFKCEHTNMRTYVLAADSQELMMQWVRNLNLASLLQTNIEAEASDANNQLYYSQSNENSDSGFNQQYTNARSTPLHTHSSSNTTDLSNPNHELSQYNQPLYANAPPKPRRLNDGGYSSPSPDVLDKCGEPKYVTLQPPGYMQRNVSGSPCYGNQEYLPERPYEHSINQNVVQSMERRTPDTYGRSKSYSSKDKQIDYEDVYSVHRMYKRPLSPLASSDKRPVIVAPRKVYTPVSILDSRDVPYTHYLRKSPNTIPRPHSADFLEYEVNNKQIGHIHRQPRPKSSLDINRNASNDNYFYSEERYAEKMRKSALYLSKLPKQSATMPVADNTFPLMRSTTQPVQYNSRNEYNRREPTMCSKSVLSEGSLSHELELDWQRNFPKSISPMQHEMYAYKDEYDPFARSASARLANIEQRLQGDGRNAINKEGERKREESMKRLLEWKQRMLQSPLNRKMNQNVNKSSGKLEVYKSQDNYNVKYMDMYREKGKHGNPFNYYNSYSSDDEASGSMSLSTRDNYARNMLSRHMWNSTQQIHTKSASNLNRSHDSDYAISAAQQDYYIPHTPSQYDISVDRTSKVVRNDKMNVSAGELLGRTHEELVLLLIQLRRQSTNTCHAIEICYNEIDNIQAQLHMMDAAKRMENLQKLEHIKQHLLELEKQYEKGKPLVNLVDNMVKLGSLYRSPHDKNTSVRDRLEFNQQIQERRLLAEERRDWNRLNSSHMQLQEKVQQLYQLDRLIQEESGTLQGLQHDKEEIERALGGLKRRLMQGFSDPTKIEQARKQQAILENELSRVHLMLAQNSKKLEETVAGNARLEQELLVLKQKLQISRQNRSSPQFSTADDSLPCVVGTNIILESDLQKVQQKVSDLQRQRQDLSMQVRQLTDRSSSLQQPAKPTTEQNEKPQSTQAAANKKKMHSLWRETDLDTMNIIDHGDMWKHPASPTGAVLYVNAEAKPDESEYLAAAAESGSDDANQNFMPQEKQEIKTVRIVKRESERRQRDRERSVVTGKWEVVSEEEEPQKPEPYFEAEEKSPELSPVFKSEAARQIITEMSQDPQPKQQLHRRAVPKEKRRHYTAPHNNLLIKSLNELPTDANPFDKMLVNTRRARDDLDMERALRQRIDAPDVVRSTLSNKELKYNESTIDNLLGTPNKINIPERYIPEQLPQLSAEEQEQRMKKVESIKKMLSDTTILSASTANLAADDVESTSTVTTKATTKMIEEKKQREHLLQLNQILAKQVMEMSKIVAGTNSAAEQ